VIITLPLPDELVLATDYNQIQLIHVRLSRRMRTRAA
jgi:hypothetical protein